MGIPHLKRHVRPYAVRNNLDGREVVVDGPGLAYHILDLCLRGTTRKSPFEHPSYELLGSTAIDWLRLLRLCGASVSAIYFDGYLPESKTQERHHRLRELFKGLRAYFASHPRGVPYGGVGDCQEVVLFPESPRPGSSDKLPVPAFIVPAVIEALKGSEFGEATRVVPGEADSFCAAYVRLHGGVILTSDSDLLVHDIGPNGSMTFFTDLELRVEGGRKSMVLAEYMPAHVCTRLSIPLEGGLQALAFELSTNRTRSLQHAVDLSRSGSSDVPPSPERAVFVKQFSSPEVVGPELSAPLLFDLDPRISEFVLKASVLSSRNQTVPAHTISEAVAYPADIPVYLPSLLDSPSRTSAWEASRTTRELAYGLVQILVGEPIHWVIEFRRLQAPSGGTRIRMPPVSDLDRDCRKLLGPMSRIRGTGPHPELQWVVFSVYQDIVTSIEKGKSKPLSIQALQQETSGNLDPASWEVLHLFAQVQATIYSLRMLQQVMNVVLGRAGDLPASFAELHSYLSEIPALAAFPLLENFAPSLRRTIDTGRFAALASAFSFTDDIMNEISAVLNPRKEEQAKVAKPSRRSHGRPVSNNLFDILGAD